MAIVWSIAPPASMRGSVGDDVVLRIEATSDAGPDIVYTVVDQPPGLSLGETTGDINGALTQAGVYEAVYTATDAAMDTVQGPSQWIVTQSQLTTHDTYITEAELRVLTSTPTGHDERIQLVCLQATQWVQWRCGDTLTNDPVDWPVTLYPVPTTVGRKTAAHAAATRFWASPQAPFGVVGGLGDLSTRVTYAIPEAELALLGEREGFGIG